MFSKVGSYCRTNTLVSNLFPIATRETALQDVIGGQIPVVKGYAELIIWLCDDLGIFWFIEQSQLAVA